MRYVIEAFWAGRPQHCEVTTRAKYARAVENLGRIIFTDGTVLILTVRELKPREKAPRPINGYGSLIGQCVRQGKSHVADLVEEKRT